MKKEDNHDLDKKILKKKFKNSSEAVDMICDTYRLTNTEKMRYVFPKLSTEINISLCKFDGGNDIMSSGMVVAINDTKSKRMKDFRIVKDTYYGFNYNNFSFTVVGKKFAVACDMEKQNIKLIFMEPNNEDEE